MHRSPAPSGIVDDKALAQDWTLQRFSGTSRESRTPKNLGKMELGRDYLTKGRNSAAGGGSGIGPKTWQRVRTDRQSITKLYILVLICKPRYVAYVVYACMALSWFHSFLFDKSIGMFDYITLL